MNTNQQKTKVTSFGYEHESGFQNRTQITLLSPAGVSFKREKHFSRQIKQTAKSY